MRGESTVRLVRKYYISPCRLGSPRCCQEMPLVHTLLNPTSTRSLQVGSRSLRIIYTLCWSFLSVDSIIMWGSIAMILIHTYIHTCGDICIYRFSSSTCDVPPRHSKKLQTSEILHPLLCRSSLHSIDAAVPRSSPFSPARDTQCCQTAA